MKRLAAIPGLAFLALVVWAPVVSAAAPPRDVVAAAQPAGDVVSATATPDDGGVFAFTAAGDVIGSGDAHVVGTLASEHLNQPIVGGASVGDASYWMVASDGGIFAFGVPFFGSMGAHHLNQPIVGMAATPDGKGYWLVASDGGIFAFGDAGFYGSTGSMVLNQPIVGMASTPSGHGYYLVAADGGVFTFGDARYEGSTGSLGITDVVGMAVNYTNAGYSIAERDGVVHNFGDASYGQVATDVGEGAVAILAKSDAHYLLVKSDGSIDNDDDSPWQATFGSPDEYAFYFGMPIGWACGGAISVYYDPSGATAVPNVAGDLVKLSEAYGQTFTMSSDPNADITIGWSTVAPQAGAQAWTYETYNGSTLTHLQIGLLAGGLVTPIDSTTALLHELGHQGLTDITANHEEEGASLTNSEARGGRFGAGDLAGLAADHAACGR